VTRAAKRQCEGRRDNGSRCRASALPGEPAVCRRHTLGYVAPKPRKVAVCEAREPEIDHIVSDTASAYEGLDSVGRCEHHVATMRDHETSVRENDAVGPGSAGWRLDRINGHAIRAFVALLEYLDEQPEAREDAGQRGADPVGAGGADTDGDRVGPGRVVPAAGEAADVVARRDRFMERVAAAGDPGPGFLCVAGVEPAPSLVLSERGVDLYHASWRQLAEVARAAGGVDAMFPDCPYSSRTHRGHDEGTASANRVANWATGKAARGEAAKANGASVATALRDAVKHGTSRRLINYQPWTPDDVAAFVDAWAPLTRGWFCTLTDHVLAPAWEAALEAQGRYVFSPISCVEPGSRFRATGDGPSQWSCMLVVSRPASMAWLTEWRTKRRGLDLSCALPGAYVVGEAKGDARSGRRDGSRVPGGKPLSLIRAILRDYAFPGETVADPTCGGGTVGEGCLAEGMRALLGDTDASHVEIARKRILAAPGYQHRLRLDVDATPMVATALDFGAVGS
jgi:hypothetical protein